LDVLDECHFELVAARELADDGWYPGQAGDASGTQPPFACDELVAIQRLVDQDRLKDAVLDDAGRETLERLVVDQLARLVGVGTDLVEREIRRGGQGRSSRRD
jgi:hypothetical protein